MPESEVGISVQLQVRILGCGPGLELEEVLLLDQVMIAVLGIQVPDIQ